MNVPVEAWIDDTRIDVHNPGSALGELMTSGGYVEIDVPIDLGALGKTMTVKFPASALLRLNNPRSHGTDGQPR